MKNKIIHGDCLSVLKKMKDSSVDMTLTSPPYDGMREYNGYSFDFQNIAKELYRVTKMGGVVVWIVNDSTLSGSETGSSFRQALYFKGIGFNLHDTMIWLKPHFSNPSSNRYHQVFEYMFILSKGKPKTFNPIKDLPIKYGKPVGKNSLRKKDGSIVNRDVTTKVADFSMRHNVWKMNTVGQENFGKKVVHPAMFPEALAHDHIFSWSNKGDVILDPFCGSGTTLKIAKKLKRKYVGIDISKEYCELSEKRILE